MRRICRGLLLVFAFAIPWEISLDFGEPLGPVARIAGVLLVLMAIPAVLQAGRMRRLSPLHWAVLALYLWFCCTYFWTIEPPATLEKLRAYFQEMMIVWLVWEFAESSQDLRALLRAYVAGSWVLALLTIVNFSSPNAAESGQIRFVAEGQNANDVARFLVLGFPMAALLFDSESRWLARFIALGYLPLGLFAVVLTASRGGAVATAFVLAGCALLLARKHARAVMGGLLAMPPLAGVVWMVVPPATIARLGSILSEVQGGDLNDRVNIWVQGWHAFAQAPLIGTGLGTFVSAAGLAAIDTAHNSVLSIAVSGGLCGLFLAFAVFVLVIGSLRRIRGPLGLALAITLLVWAITSLTASVEENRSTWMLFALIALAGRLAVEEPGELAACFPSGNDLQASEALAEPVL
jgi:O-antigen ligase